MVFDWDTFWAFNTLRAGQSQVCTFIGKTTRCHFLGYLTLPEGRQQRKLQIVCFAVSTYTQPYQSDVFTQEKGK